MKITKQNTAWPFWWCVDVSFIQDDFGNLILAPRDTFSSRFCRQGLEETLYEGFVPLSLRVRRPAAPQGQNLTSV